MNELGHPAANRQFSPHDNNFRVLLRNCGLDLWIFHWMNIPTTNLLKIRDADDISLHSSLMLISILWFCFNGITRGVESPPDCLWLSVSYKGDLVVDQFDSYVIYVSPVQAHIWPRGSLYCKVTTPQYQRENLNNLMILMNKDWATVGRKSFILTGGDWVEPG